MEHKAKNRDWVKNAAIVFLAVLLVLTFFSNTWMNRSLPEVATKYVTNGTITAKVRGTGTVSAVGVTSVKAEQTREIRAVMVKVGQEVKVGDVLFVLGQGEASELETAQEKLRQLELSYQRTAVGISYPSYAADERRIQTAKEAYDRAEAVLQSIIEIINGEDEGKTLSELTKQLEEAERIREAEQEAYDELVAAAKDDLALKAQERDDAQRALIQNGISFVRTYDQDGGTKWEFIDSKGRTVILNDNGQEEIASASTLSTSAKVYPVYHYELSTLSMFISETPENAENQRAEPSNELTDQTEEKREGEEKVEGDTSLTQAPGEVSNDSNNNSADESAGESVSGTTPQAETTDPGELELMRRFQEKQKNVIAATNYLESIPRTNLDSAEERVDNAQRKISEFIIHNAQFDSEEYIEAKAARDSAYETYLALVDTLNEKRAADARNQALSYLDLSDLNAQIEAARKKVTELSGGVENQVLAKSAGMIETIDCAPGDTKLKGDLLCTIQVPDLGYTMSFSVTNDQARRLKPGDSATVSNYYWGNQIVATLESIKADPKNPQTNKLLTFEVKGDVSAGTELTISVGQKSANYDCIVPNSAIRNDTNGAFVLVIESKSSPLGNRYIARRVDVKILAEDDVNSAVTGELNNGDYVITTSNAPVKNGDLVRLADNG